jgi:alginate O-acetyltransferase complex protein AlgI
MTLNSLQFFMFLSAVYVCFYFAPARWRWFVLLTASYCFYAAFLAPYLLVSLLTVTVISYVFGIRIAACSHESIRKRWFYAGIAACLSVLIVLKYLPVFIQSPLLVQFVLTVGVSYYCFQSISYLVDVYLEVEAPEGHIGYFALYLAFFPKLLQGPIERAGDLLPQLKKPYEYDYSVVRSGLLLFARGLFKKVVIADRLALYADQVFNNLHDYTGVSLILGCYAYSLQIYFDFSGYTDMARGTGLIFGINLTENFNSPYLSTSVSDFWRRWHISFSRWILDYIFKPLQMVWRDYGKIGTSAALIVTFLASGIWHGATWGFIVWGLLHGIYLVAGLYYRPFQKKVLKSIGMQKSRLVQIVEVIVTFNLICFAWIFFRTKYLTDARYFVSHLFSFVNPINSTSSSGTYVKKYILLGLGDHNCIVLIVSLFVYLGSQLLARKHHVLNIKQMAVRWSFYYGLAMYIIFFGIFKGDNFVYFKF